MQAITGTVQAYPWGSTDGIPAALGTADTGEPQAELWLGAHPKAPSRLADGRSLADHLSEHPEEIGTTSVNRFGPRLPFLLKVLSAARALSLQAHPSRAQAVEGFAREDAEQLPLDAPHRNYRDDWPKPEALLALTEFHGLCGFRDPDETRALFARLGVPEADQLVEPLTDRDGIARVFLEILGLADAEDDLVREVVEAARPHAGEDSEFGRFCATAVELAADYRDDAGILAALLLNRITLAPGEAFFMPAGNLHAYLRGTGIEIMSNSDNVLRGGLTGKHVDLDELARVVDFAPGFPGTIEPVDEGGGVRRLPTPAPEFELWELTDCHDRELPADGSGRILLVVDGTATLRRGDEELVIERGGAAFVGATETGVRVSGPARGFLASDGA
ncbi:mannose-6-phosphate isomerase, class I [Enemella dayhoffiae]|uniref:mannose-6-phosphate isomerase n=1 Tax=Enemella dayhoffiae TaxID=2016507 RepID=A0A255HC02_9ACTN|nr:mannose-6-phosphate isomerase, class I [Enemella dayhoffiae]OYO24473.1 mannose-6-phosphate isomerase, class I [Enemella dayhoffiae]